MFNRKISISLLILGMIICISYATVDAGEKNNIPREEAEKLAIEHQTNGISFEDAGKFKEAVEEYQKSLEYVPDNSDTLFNLGVVYLKLNRTVDAAAMFEKLVKVSKDDVEGYNLLGIAYRGCGKEADAKKAWEKSLKINPEQPQVKEMLNDASFKK